MLEPPRRVVKHAVAPGNFARYQSRPSREYRLTGSHSLAPTTLIVEPSRGSQRRRQLLFSIPYALVKGLIESRVKARSDRNSRRNS